MRGRLLRRHRSVTHDYTARGMSAALHVAPITANQVPLVAPLLARAFDDDDGYKFLFPDRARRTRGLTEFFAGNLRTHLDYRCTFAASDSTNDVLATVTVRPPGGVRISMLTMLRHGLVPFALRNGTSAVERLLRLKRIYDALEAELAQGRPHWHIHMMAVAPERQGSGLGRNLLADVLARTVEATAESRAIPTVLTTHSERNVAFYRRAGFEVVFQRTLAPPDVDTPYTVWGMRR
jgi:ribosomal protein S18 acetylase RimI-like enzyme